MIQLLSFIIFLQKYKENLTARQLKTILYVHCHIALLKILTVKGTGREWRKYNIK